MDNDTSNDVDWSEDVKPTEITEPSGNYWNERYSNAFGDYRGGYGPGGGYGSYGGYGPVGGFGPRSYFRPGNFRPGNFPPGNFPPGNFPPGNFPPGNFPPGNFPPGPGYYFPTYPPPNMWGRGFGSGGPPGPYRHSAEERGSRYLSPRLHYVGKTHSKNQKKWILENHGEFQQGREIPLKSRDLYCELCDVQITSKLHAESHYAGRPHRAVVEGRKEPRNTFLHQKGTESRLEQLIRREKKCLKTAVKGDKNVVQELNDINPDLFCNICKATMSCSEQMTMHLNGKRHLTKEKQHIFKTMKAKDKSAQEYKVDTKDTPEEDTQDKKDGESEDQDNTFDWGKGSGAWDET